MFLNVGFVLILRRLKDCGYDDRFFNISKRDEERVRNFYEEAKAEGIKFAKIVGNHLEAFCRGQEYSPDQAIYTLLKRDAETVATDANDTAPSFSRSYRRGLTTKVKNAHVKLRGLLYPTAAVTAVPIQEEEGEQGGEDDGELSVDGESNERDAPPAQTDAAIATTSTSRSSSSPAGVRASTQGAWDGESVMSVESDGPHDVDEKKELKCNTAEIMSEADELDPDNDIISLTFQNPKQHLVLCKCSHPLRLAFASWATDLKEKKQLPVHITCIVGFLNLYAEIGILVQCSGFEGVRTVTFLQPQMPDRYKMPQCSIAFCCHSYRLCTILCIGASTTK